MEALQVLWRSADRAARVRWLTRYDGFGRLTHADNTSNVTLRQYPVNVTANRTSATWLGTTSSL